MAKIHELDPALRFPASACYPSADARGVAMHTTRCALLLWTPRPPLGEAGELA
jgi:hypothetical protein